MSNQSNKIVLTINLEERNPICSDVKISTKNVQTSDGKTKEIVDKIQHIWSKSDRKQPVQVVNLTQDQYDYYISRESKPNKSQAFKQHFEWNKMSNIQRLEWHLEQISNGDLLLTKL